MDPTNQEGYASQQGFVSNPRQTEGRALAEVARRLSAAQESGNEDQILEAVRLNMRLWTIFQAELLQPDCPVPLEIRQNVLSLASFIDRRIADLLFKPEETEKITVLVNINRHLAAGLLANTEEEALEAEDSTSEDAQPSSFNEEI